VGGLPTGTVNGFAVDTTNPKAMLVAMRDSIFRSEDAGARWLAVRGSPQNVAVVAINPRQQREAYAAAADGQVFVSRDGGQTWEPVH
jgi:photosystem II stability/assembly factor-like uncharacterized protein